VQCVVECSASHSSQLQAHATLSMCLRSTDEQLHSLEVGMLPLHAMILTSDPVQLIFLLAHSVVTR